MLAATLITGSKPADSATVSPTGFDGDLEVDPVGLQEAVKGGASHIIGLAFDGYPIYGNRDIDGKRLRASDLDR